LRYLSSSSVCAAVSWQILVSRFTCDIKKGTSKSILGPNALTDRELFEKETPQFRPRFGIMTEAV
jgi:hypothetical protein